MRKLIILLGLILGACSHTLPSIPAVTESLVLDPKLLESCKLLTASKVSSPDDILLENISLYEKYGECARKQENSIKALKLIGDIK